MPTARTADKHSRMKRHVFDHDRIHPAIREKIAKNHVDIVEEVRAAIEKHDVVVVGMAQNPHVRKTKNALEEAKIDFHYLEYGSYFSEWKKRLAIKLWSGWPTFPQVFVRGVLIGGEDRTKAAIADGSLSGRAAASPSPNGAVSKAS